MEEREHGTCAPRRRFRRKAAILKALAHESRLVIIDRLLRGECCVCDLARLTELDQSTVSRHLSTLANAGIVEGHRRSHHVYYSLSAPWVKDLIESGLDA
jgi:DNA-binding transcriptional ArsR family regulator